MRKFIASIIALIAPIMFLTACGHRSDGNYGDGWGDIGFNNVVQLPMAFSNNQLDNVDGVQIIQFHNIESSWNPFSPFGNSLLRVTSNAGLGSILGLGGTLPPDITDEEQKALVNLAYMRAQLLEQFDDEFFANQNLFVLSFIAGAVTIGITLESISSDGHITITETHSGRRNATIPSIGIDKLFAIEIDSDFNPDNISITHRQVWTGRG